MNNNYYYGNFQPQINTNIILVTSLEEALMKTNSYNSDMLYLHQDMNVMYRVKVDRDGRKSWAEFNYTMPDPNANIPATRADLQSFENRIRALEEKFGKENVDGELNG